MPEHFEHLVYFFKIQIFLTLFYFPNDCKSNTGPFSKLFLCKIYFLSFLLYKISKHHHNYMLLQRIETNLLFLYVKTYKNIFSN